MRRVLSYMMGISLVLGMACQPLDLTSDLVISLDTNIIKTFLSFRFFNAESGNLIGASGEISVTLMFSGDDAGAVVTQTGDRIDQTSSVAGLISLGLDPYGQYEILPGHPVVFTVEASAPGFQSTHLDLVISHTGVNTCLVPMQPVGTSSSKPQVINLHTGNIRDGRLTTGFRVVAAGNSMELIFPDSIEFISEDGSMADGELSVNATHYNTLSETPTGDAQVMRFDKDGVIGAGILEPESIMELNLSGQTSGKITQIPGNPLLWRFQTDASRSAGDSIPIWYYEEIGNFWSFSGFAQVTEGDGQKIAEAQLSHLSLYTAGEVSGTRSLTGHLTLSFEKEFLEPSFDGQVVVSDDNTGEILQRIPIRIYAGLDISVGMDVPAGRNIRIAISALLPDFQLTSQPGSIVVSSDQDSFTQSFTLRPTKCRFSGTVTFVLPPEFNRLPLNVWVKVRDAESGQLYKTINASLTSTRSSTPISMMLPENRRIRISLEPIAINLDFDASPLSFEVGESCTEFGQWNFDVSPKIPCQATGTIHFSIHGHAPHDPVPVLVKFLRASDNELIDQISVQVPAGGLNWDFEVPVPLSTPVKVKLQNASGDKLLQFSSSVIEWTNPCWTPLSAQSEITPQYAQIKGEIDFTYNPDDYSNPEIPMIVRFYQSSNDQEIGAYSYLVTPQNKQIQIDAVTPAESVYMKITRANQTIRFNPVPYKIEIPDPYSIPASWNVTLWPTQLLPVHFLVKVVCPGGEVYPTIQGYYRLPGDNWSELYITNGNLNINVEVGLTYEVGMFLGGHMIDSTFTVTQQENTMIFPLDEADCKRMGWGE